MKKFNFDIQFFGEGDGEGSGTTQTTPAIDYERIEQIVMKRSESTADSVLKGYLKQQGLTGDELEQAVKDYKNHKAQAKKDAETEHENMKLENQKLKEQILNSNIDSKLTSLATNEGVKADKIPFLLKLVDRTGLANEKGEIDEAKVKSSIENVLKAFPDFKTKDQNSNGFQQIGSNGSEDNNNPIDDKLDAIFGIKKK